VPELTIIERAQQALAIEHTEAELKNLAGKSADVTEIKDEADYQLVKSSRINLKTVRVSIQKAGKAARDDANKFSKAVISEEKRLLSYIQPEEQRLHALQAEKDEEAEREAERVRKIEGDRVAAIISKIQGIKETAEGLLGADSGEILRRLQTVNAIQCDEEAFGEYVEQAKEVCVQTAQSLNQAYNVAKDMEDQRAEQDRIAKEQAERQAKLDAEEAERKEAEKARLAKIQAREEEIARQEAEFKAKQKVEEDRKLAEERAEAQRVADEKARLEQEKRDREEIAEQERLAEEYRARQEALRPEKDRLIDWLKKLRFIDGVELSDKKLINIQKVTLSGLNELSVEGIQLVEDA